MAKKATPAPLHLTRPANKQDAEKLIAAWRNEGYVISALATHYNLVEMTASRWIREAMKILGVTKAQLAPVPIPEGMIAGKSTVQYDAHGNIIQEWRRLHPYAEDVEKWVVGLEKRVVGKAPRIPAPRKVDTDLLLEIPIPDHHFGALAWAEETGADYDIHIAEKLLVDSIARTLSDTPVVGKIALINMGDFYHADGRQAVTEKSGHLLDVDSRFDKRIDAAVAALCRCIELALTHAKSVEVISIAGNHDGSATKWTSRVLSAYYRNDPRITVRTNPRNRQYIQHGRVMLSYMHGDCLKSDKFGRVIPAEQPKMWSETEFRYGRIGHWHHRVTEEYPGIVIETLPTLAAPDAYAAEHGYMSRRALTTFLWSAQWGLRRKMELSVGEILGKR